MDEEIAKQLREPFPADRIGKLPKLTCSACQDSRTKNCEKHPKTKCSTCGNWLSTSHIHVDYVGHADITARFLDVDAEWDWEPVARDVDRELLRAAIDTGNADIVALLLESSPPKLDGNGGLWMRVTIAGTTRLGYGDGSGRRGTDGVKIAIGDGLRNAGMRFGTGLDMWRKELDAGDTGSTAQPPAEQRTNPAWLTSIRDRIAAAASEQELLTLAHEIEAKVQGGYCQQADYEDLWQRGEARLREVQHADAQKAARVADLTTEAETAEATGDLATAYRARLEAADTIEAVTDLKSEVMAAFKDQKLDPTEGNGLLTAIQHKQRELGTSTP